MEVTNGDLWYQVKSAKEAARLEAAVRAFPARVELSDFTHSRERPSLVAMSAGKEIMIRPKNCSIRNIYAEPGISTSVETNTLRVYKYNGVTYNFFLELRV